MSDDRYPPDLSSDESVRVLQLLRINDKERALDALTRVDFIRTLFWNSRNLDADRPNARKNRRRSVRELAALGKSIATVGRQLDELSAHAKGMFSYNRQQHDGSHIKYTVSLFDEDLVLERMEAVRLLESLLPLALEWIAEEQRALSIPGAPGRPTDHSARQLAVQLAEIWNEFMGGPLRKDPRSQPETEHLQQPFEELVELVGRSVDPKFSPAWVTRWVDEFTRRTRSSCE